MEKQLQEITVAFHNASTVLADYDKKNGIIAPDEQLAKLADATALWKSAIDDANIDEDAQKSILNKAKNVSNNLPNICNWNRR